MSQAFHRFQMKMKTKMSILDQELSQSAVGVYKILRFTFIMMLGGGGGMHNSSSDGSS